MKLSNIQRAIIKTLAFYQVFKISLSEKELYNNLYQNKCTGKDFERDLQKLVKKNVVFKKTDYFTLIDSQKIISERIEKLSVSEKRWMKVARVVKRLHWIPFVRMIAVVNSLSFNNSSDESDIDLFVVTKKDRLWICRFFLILFLDLIGENKNSRVQKNRFCLGFWIDESELNLKKFLFNPEDVYFYYWLIHMEPVLGNRKYEEFISVNKWIHNYFPNRKLHKKNQPEKSNKMKNFLEKIFSGKLGDILEKFFRKLQIVRIWKFPENKRSGASVVATKSVLKLHAYDKRKIYQEKYLSIIGKYF